MVVTNNERRVMSISKRLNGLSNVSLLVALVASLVICSFLVTWFFKGLVIVKFGWLISLVMGFLVLGYLDISIRIALILYRRYTQNKLAS